MNEKLKLALEKLNQNEALLEEIKKEPPKCKQDVIELAKRLGVELTEADLPFSEDMTEEELKQVAGGKTSKSDMIQGECGGIITVLCRAIFDCAQLTPTR